MKLFGFSWVAHLSLLLLSLVFPLSLPASPSPVGIEVYKNEVHLSLEYKQKIAADLYRYQTAGDIWNVLRQEFVLPHYEDHPRVQEQIEYFLNHPDFLFNTMTRAAPYLYFILQQVHSRHLPVELVLLPIIESGYNPFAYSNRGAAGLWQIMPGTALGFGIKPDSWYDGRRDLITSTRAALDYLTYLGGFFEGSWQLAIAAYDTGEGNVLSAIKRNIRDGKSTDYWSLPLSQETRIYVPRLLALAAIISHPENYPVKFPPIQNAPYLAQVDIGAQIDLAHAARLAGLSLKTIKHLNPGHNQLITDPKGPFHLVLPIERVERFSENLSHSPLYQQINWTQYRTQPGDSLPLIAKRYNTTTDTLRKANPTLVSQLKPGTPVIIPHKSAYIKKSPTLEDLTESDLLIAKKDIINSAHPSLRDQNSFTAIANAFNTAPKYQLQPGDTLYMIRNNDNLEKIAQRFHISKSTLMTVNQLKTSSVQPGAQLIIPTHQALATATQKYQLTPGDTIYMVRSGETIDHIARKFHTTPHQIRLANLLTDNILQEGDRLVIPTHA